MDRSCSSLQLEAFSAEKPTTQSAALLSDMMQEAQCSSRYPHSELPMLLPRIRQPVELTRSTPELLLLILSPAALMLLQETRPKKPQSEGTAISTSPTR